MTIVIQASPSPLNRPWKSARQAFEPVKTPGCKWGLVQHDGAEVAVRKSALDATCLPPFYPRSSAEHHRTTADACGQNAPLCATSAVSLTLGPTIQNGGYRVPCDLEL